MGKENEGIYNRKEDLRRRSIEVNCQTQEREETK